LAKERDERLKTTTGATSEAEEKKVLQTTPISIIEYFRTLRADLLRDNTSSEINVLSVPLRLMETDVDIQTDGRNTKLIIPRPGLSDLEVTLDLPLTWLLMFNTKTLKKYDILKFITEPDVERYINVLSAANLNNDPKTSKVGELREIFKQQIQSFTRFPPFEDPDIINYSFMELLKYIWGLGIKKGYDPKTNPMHPVIARFMSGDPRKKSRGKIPVYQDSFLYKADFPTEPQLVISENDSTKGTRRGILYMAKGKQNQGNIITINFNSQIAPYDEVGEVFKLESPFSKFKLLLGPYMGLLRDSLKTATGNNDLYDNIYDYQNLPRAQADILDADIAKITEWIEQKNKSGLGMISQEPLYGVLRDPFKDASTVKSRKGNSMHKSYIISGGMFGDLEVNVPKLYTQMHLTAKKGGAVVLDTPVDLDTIELLTKRPKRTRSYSQLAVKNLAKMVKLSDQAVNPNSKKLKMVQKYHSKKRAALPVNADDATIERLTTLILEHQAGNFPNTNLQNEIAQISDTLLKQGMITEKMHKEIYGKYVL
jgi:hypothetical protein